MPMGEAKEKRPLRADPLRAAREKTPGACGDRLRGEHEGGAEGDRKRQENAKALSKKGIPKVGTGPRRTRGDRPATGRSTPTKPPNPICRPCTRRNEQRGMGRGAHPTPSRPIPHPAQHPYIT